MKKQILTLGKVLNKSEQKQVNGGFDVVGIKKLKCYLGGQCIRYSTACKETICWYNPA